MLTEEFSVKTLLQGGTIKLLVKQLNIELESDQGSVIGVEVQDKVHFQDTGQLLTAMLLYTALHCTR